jgi:hypothetical protein
MLRSRLALLSLGLLSAVSLGAQAQTTTVTTTPVVEKYVIVSPAPKGVCTTINGHWEGAAWVATHEVCKYENRTEGVNWVGEYWSCTASTADGNCTTWVLVPGHWEAQ